MKKKIVKGLSLALAGALVIPAQVSAYTLDAAGNSEALVEYQDSTDEDFSNEVSVFAQIGSIYSVTIPKVIVLSGKDKNASFLVKVEGDIAGYETIKVVPDETVTLKSNNKSDVTGIITQDKISWTYADLGTDANGSVVAEDLTSGKWSGTFNFNINLESSETPVVELPPAGTTLSKMSFKDIQNVAAAGKTADYNIKVGDQIAVNDSVNAEIIKIGSDYIEFATTSKIVSATTPVTTSYTTKYNSMYGNVVQSQGPAAYYTKPQVNTSEKTNTAQVGYNGSDLQTNVRAWFDSQSEDFKAVVMDTNHTYDVSTLSYNTSTLRCGMVANGTVTVTEKVYIPSEYDCKNGKLKNSSVIKNCFWTSSIANYGLTGHEHPCGCIGNFVYNNGDGTFDDNFGNNGYGAIAMFRIG